MIHDMLRRGIRRSWAPEGTHMAGARRRRSGRLESPFWAPSGSGRPIRGRPMRLSTPDYCGLRGEGSIPVPLPPPSGSEIIRVIGFFTSHPSCMRAIGVLVLPCLQNDCIDRTKVLTADWR
jgi:hypothetical protein